jgi:lysozyme
MAAKRSKKKKINRRVAWILLSLLLVTGGIVFKGYEWWMYRKAKFKRYAAFGISIPDVYPIHGIDVSRYQEVIAWEEVKAMQVKNVKIGFAFIKATEGISSVDQQFKRNWKKAKQNGVVRGAYHYFHPTKDGRAQAQSFIKTVELESGDLPPVVDIEVLNNVSAATMRKELKEWLVIVENHYKVKPIIYTNVDFYSNWLKKEFDSYPLWAAHYFEYTEPRINRNWIFWQHSDEGRVNGIVYKVDFNVFNGDSVAFRNLLVD